MARAPRKTRTKASPKKEVITTEAVEAARAVSDFMLLDELKRRCDESDTFCTLMTEAVCDRLILSTHELKLVYKQHDQELYDEDDMNKLHELAVRTSEPVALAARVVYDNDAYAAQQLRHWLQREANAFGSHAVLL